MNSRHPGFRFLSYRRSQAAGPMGFLPVGALPGIVIPLRLRQQGFYRGNANYGSALSAKPLLTSCIDDGVAIGLPVGGSSLHPQHLE